MKRWISHSLSLLVGGYFIWSGLSKLALKDDFFQSILNYQLVGENIAWSMTLFLPWLEFIAGMALIKPTMRLSGLCWIGAMLVVFEVALASALFRGLDIDCGCVGSGGSSVTFALVRNGFLLAALAAIYFIERNFRNQLPK